MKLITDEYWPRKVRRRFPRSHTFLVTAVFKTPVRVAEAQTAVRRKVAGEFFGPDFKITKVRRRSTRRPRGPANKSIF